MKSASRFTKALSFTPIEPLEARIAPASVTFTDVDGDTVTVTTSKGTVADLQMRVDSAVNMGQMQTLNLSDAAYAGTNLKIAVTTKGATGDGLVNVWAVNAAGFDLGSVEVRGDLAKLTAGDTNYGNGSVKSVKVQSIGVNGGAAAKDWALLGSTNTFTVTGDVNGATIIWSNPDVGGDISVKTLSIGGDLIGGGADNTGYINVIGGGGDASLAEIKTLTIGGSLVSTNYDYSGSVVVGSTNGQGTFLGKIGKASVGGSLIGFTAKDYTGSLYASAGIGDVTVGGSLFGGGEGSGSLYAYFSNMGTVKVGGSLFGGSGLNSGSIFAGKDLKAATVGGSLSGSTGAYGGSVVAYQGVAGNVTVNGSLSGGSTGVYSGAIYGDRGLGNVFVGGSVTGGNNDFAGSIGTDTSMATTYKTGNVTILGDLRGGTDFITGSISSATLGTIKIGGTLEGGTQASAGSIYAKLGFASVTIGKDIQGGSTTGAGTINSAGPANSNAFITVGGNVVGGTATNTGSILVSGKLGKLSIGGSLFGGTVANSGHVSVATIGDLSVGDDVEGGSASSTGILSGGTLTGKLIVGGNVRGGFNNSSSSGGISFTGSVKSIEIKGDLIGSTTSAASVTNAGFVGVTGALGSITIGGSIIGGTAFNTTDFNLGSVRAGSIGTMLVKGDVIGNGNHYVTISGQGDITQTSGKNLAIKSLTINGSVSYTNILGGYNLTGNTLNGAGGTDGGSAQIGTVTVLGDFFTSSIATGVSNGNAAKNHWADNANTLLSKPAGSNIVASISKIILGGAVDATVQNGIAAERILSLSIGGLPVTVATGAQFFQPSPSTVFKVQQVVA